MLAAIVTVLAQNSQEVPEKGVGIGLILLAVLFVLLVAFAIFTAFTKLSKGRRGAGPPERKHDPDSVGH